jgi:hypothetical protein
MDLSEDSPEDSADSFPENSKYGSFCDPCHPPMSYFSSSPPTPQISHHPSYRRLGSYLLEAGLINNAQIEVVLNDQQTMDEMRFGEVLVARGWIKPETIDFLMRRVIEPERALQLADLPPPPAPPPPPLPIAPPWISPQAQSQRKVVARARSLDGDVEFDIVHDLSDDLMPTVPLYRSTGSHQRQNDRKSLPSIPDGDGVNWAG